MTVQEYHRQLAQRLEGVFDPGEARAAARAILEDVAGYDTRFLVMHSDREMLAETAARLDRVADLVLQGTPVQYATGHARFCGMDLRVSPAVLIPRPETQGLVDLIADAAGDRSDLRVLDVGTGSGCIAIALARALRFAHVTGVDISSAALDVARENAEALKVHIGLMHCDILQPDDCPEGPFDVIVSNPPYIAPDEADEMEDRVLHYEPLEALFVPEDDPLVFYRAISRYAAKALRPGGSLYFEINPRFADETAALVRAEGFDSVDMLPDYLGRKRFITASL